MKRLLLYVCLLTMLTGCGWFSNGNNQNHGTTTQNPTTPNQTDDGGTTDNNLNGSTNTNSMYNNVSEYMDALRIGGMNFMNEKDITDFNFPAYEGKEFTVDEQPFYLYRVDSNNLDVKNMLDEIDKNGYVSTTQDGKETKKYAYRMGDFVLIYPEGYDIQKVQSILNKKV